MDWVRQQSSTKGGVLLLVSLFWDGSYVSVHHDPVVDLQDSTELDLTIHQSAAGPESLHPHPPPLPPPTTPASRQATQQNQEENKMTIRNQAPSCVVDSHTQTQTHTHTHTVQYTIHNPIHGKSRQ